MRCPESRIDSCPSDNKMICYTSDNNAWPKTYVPPISIKKEMKELEDITESFESLLSNIEFAYPNDKEKIRNIFYQLLESSRNAGKKGLKNLFKNYFII